MVRARRDGNSRHDERRVQPDPFPKPRCTRY